MTRFLAIAAILLATPAQAQSRCGPYDMITDGLKARYSESLRLRLVHPSSLTEIWTNDATGTWTILVRNVHGLACLRAAGQGAQWVENVEGDAT